MKDFTYEFNLGLDGWEGDFADYPKAQESIFDLKYAYRPLPAPLDGQKGSIGQSGINRSDDLFMFTRKMISGLTPNQKSQLNFTIEFASNVANNQIGVGGSPGESVWIKAGASTIMPAKVFQSDSGYYRMNIDKGNQSSGGKDMQVLGNFANGTNENVYTLKTVKNKEPFYAVSNENGELWFIVATESGFESLTAIFYNRISVQLK